MIKKYCLFLKKLEFDQDEEEIVLEFCFFVLCEFGVYLVFVFKLFDLFLG